MVVVDVADSVAGGVGNDIFSVSRMLEAKYQ